MKKINRVFLLFSLVVAFSANAQKKLNLRLKYDKEFDRYEVYVKPNFSERNFIWGPSQVSLVLPSEVLVDKIVVKNIDGGTWEDNSILQAPEITPMLSYHGISTGGEKVNLTENYETVLFYFSLPKAVNPAKVRVFDNQKDPNSRSAGMHGGDFKNSIADIEGKERFNEVYTIEENVKVEIAETKANEALDVVVFPNVITENKFKVNVKGLNDNDGEVLLILSDNLGKEVFRQRSSVSALEKQSFNLPESFAKQENLVLKLITTKGAVSKKLIAEQ